MKVKLALIGKNISHSLSPQLQKKIWGEDLLSYDLIDIAREEELPSLTQLAKYYWGLNITTPYKEAYLKDLRIESEVARTLGAINTIALKDFSAINTDALAVEKILSDYLDKIPRLRVHLLGGGVMARMTVMIAQKKGIPLISYTRQEQGDLTHWDLSMLDENDLVINSCSRSFSFQGPLSSHCHFWDYNYAFLPHARLASQVKTYQDGQELLWQQAISAAQFWQQKAKINI